MSKKELLDYKQNIDEGNVTHQYFIAPILSHMQGPREWWRDPDGAVEYAKECAKRFGCDYEVYERIAYINED